LDKVRELITFVFDDTDWS